MSLYFALFTVENNKTKKSVKFQGVTLIFCDFIHVYVFTTNHHLKENYNKIKTENKERDFSTGMTERMDGSNCG